MVLTSSARSRYINYINRNRKKTMLTIFRLCLTTPEFKDVSALEADRISRYCTEHYKQDRYDYFEVSDLAKMIFQLVLSELALNIILNQFAEEISEQSHQSGQESIRLL